MINWTSVKRIFWIREETSFETRSPSEIQQPIYSNRLISPGFSLEGLRSASKQPWPVTVIYTSLFNNTTSSSCWIWDDFLSGQTSLPLNDRRSSVATHQMTKLTMWTPSQTLWRRKRTPSEPIGILWQKFVSARSRLLLSVHSWLAIPWGRQRACDVPFRLC